MAEMQSKENSHTKRGIQRSKKLTTKVDLTPMVDLGFLLITFFIFTTTLSEPKAMKLNMPDESTGNNPLFIGNNKVLTILPAGQNKLFYYFGEQPSTMLETNYGADGLRKIILNKKREITKQYGDGQQIMVLIKPTDKSSYQNLINVLDEMLINNVTRYMLLDIDEKEKQFAVL